MVGSGKQRDALKRKASRGLEGDAAYRKYRADEDSDTDDTESIASEASSSCSNRRGGRSGVRRTPVGRRKSQGPSHGSDKPPRLGKKMSTMSGVVCAFLDLRSRSIVRNGIPEQVEDEDDSVHARPEPRRMLSAKRKLYKKSSSVGSFGPSAVVSRLSRKYSNTRAATALY